MNELERFKKQVKKLKKSEKQLINRETDRMTASFEAFMQKNNREHNMNTIYQDVKDHLIAMSKDDIKLQKALLESYEFVVKHHNQLINDGFEKFLNRD